MHALFRQSLDYRQPELAQLDTGARQLRIGFDQAGDIAGGRIAIHAQQKIGRREIEEAERVRLDHLSAVNDLAQQLRGARDTHCHDRVASLRRCQLMADGTDAADARGNARHFVEWPAFGELLEAADLRDLKIRIGHFAIVVQLDGDLGVAFNAAYRFNRDRLHENSFGSPRKHGRHGIVGFSFLSFRRFFFFRFFSILLP